LCEAEEEEMSNKDIGFLMLLGLGISNILFVWGRIVINSIEAKEWKELFWVHTIMAYLFLAIYFLCT
jgi:hypothetical protein